MVELERSQNPWVTSIEEQRVEIDGGDLSIMPELTVLDRGDAGFRPPRSADKGLSTSGAPDWHLCVMERPFSAAGAAFLSAIIVNPLDVAKTRLQAQAAGVPYSHPLSNITSRMAFFGPTMGSQRNEQEQHLKPGDPNRPALPSNLTAPRGAYRRWPRPANPARFPSRSDPISTCIPLPTL